MLHAYFDFLGDFIKTHYNNFTEDNLVVFMNSLVARIQSEMQTMISKLNGKKTLKASAKKPIKSKPTKANIRINKCWNTIRFMAEH